MKRMIIIYGFLFLASPQVQAQTGPAQPAQEDRLKALEDRIVSLEAEVKALKSAAEEAKSAPPAAPAPQAISAEAAPAAAPTPAAGVLPTYGGSPLAAKLLNPDISAIGDVTGSLGRNTIRPVPALELHEMEVGLHSIIDPYARGDVFISFGETGVNVEEAYMTFTSLPAGFVARGGEVSRGIRKIEYHPQPCAADHRPAVDVRKPCGRGRWNKRYGLFDHAPDSRAEGTFPGRHGAGVPRRFGRCVHVEPAERRQRGGPHPRLPRHLGFDQRGHRILLCPGPQQSGGRLHHSALRHRQHTPLEAAAPLDLSLVPVPQRVRLEPAGRSRRATPRVRHVLAGRVPAEPPLDARGPLRLGGSRPRPDRDGQGILYA